MKRKYIIILMQFLTSICIISLGFSSWTICMGNSLTASGNFVAEDAIEVSKYIKLTSYEALKYYQTGFVLEDEDGNYTVGDTGQVVVKYDIDIDECNNYYQSNSSKSLYVRTFLVCDSFMFDKDTFEITYELIDNNGSNITEGSSDNFIDENTYSINFLLDGVLNSSGTYSFSITYNFKFASYDDYKTTIYPALKNNNIQFNSSALINEEE